MIDFEVLVFCRAKGFVHSSIPDAVAAIEALGDQHGFGVDVTDDPDRFAVGSLDAYAALVFVHTSGDVLPEPAQRAALEQFVHGGGGFFGVHAAAAMGEVADDWPFYRALVGSSFKGHTDARLYSDEPVADGPGVRYCGALVDAPADAEPFGPTLLVSSCESAVVRVEQPSSPAARGIVDGARRVDEWYGFHDNPRSRVEVVATVDERTYVPAAGRMGDDHPVIWSQRIGAGRSVYNALGHAALTWRDPSFLASVLGGIEQAAGIPLRRR